ncbi:NAD(P)-dependent alcohol dehydrogenase [Actinomycetaceae bacterium TAE3-ERU4]|nr:NAD(P)-dependent alcohol dehydrogenase [Actinomycetaceae bacterium TAE3-ERU4]
MEIKRRQVGPHDILIDIKYAGICHSDIHTARGEWGGTYYPIVVGHEIAGIVSQVGSAVTKHKVGDAVGVGCLVDSCKECEYCTDGYEQFCTKGAVGTYDSTGYDGAQTMGGYSQQIVVRDEFALKIPEGIDLAHAAPLLCAGITTYSPLKRYGAGPGKKVAVIGLGGLGHMAVKIAAALGAEVSVISRTNAKAEAAKALGASYHYASASEGEAGLAKKLGPSFDIIINTVSAKIDLDSYLKLLRPFGTMVSVGLPPDAMKIHAENIITGNRQYAGSAIGGIEQTQEMLNFCAEHGLGAEIEVIEAGQINEAWEKVIAGDVRFRFVIDTSTLA